MNFLKIKICDFLIQFASSTKQITSLCLNWNYLRYFLSCFISVICFFLSSKIRVWCWDFDGVVFLELFLKDHLDVTLEVEIIITTCTVHSSLCHLECYGNNCTMTMRKEHLLHCKLQVLHDIFLAFWWFYFDIASKSTTPCLQTLCWFSLQAVSHPLFTMGCLWYS